MGSTAPIAYIAGNFGENATAIASHIGQLHRRQMTSRGKQPEKGPKPATVNEHIGRELRALFDGVVGEPVPEKFRQLLEQLERKQSKP